MGKVIYEDKLMQDLRRMGEIPDDVRVKVLAAVSRQPAADVAPVVHGRWIKKMDIVSSYIFNCEEVFYECSLCDGANIVDSPYCPSCGANMDGGNADGAGG